MGIVLNDRTFKDSIFKEGLEISTIMAIDVIAKCCTVLRELLGNH